jgi:UDP-glucose 4-epimerase
MGPLDEKRVLVTGGTGSLGHALVRRLLRGEMGQPRKIVVFSRDEAKQHEMRLEYKRQRSATDDIIYRNSQEMLTFRIGDVRDFESVAAAIRDADVIVNAAALKQVPTCEYFPYEAVLTNVVGPQNIVRAIREQDAPVEVLVGVSTDKACKPVNTMGMTKALQERIFLEANLECPRTRFVCVRYGNVIASRGSVVPLFLEQIRAGGPVTITLKEMSRFLLTIDQAVDTIFAALRDAQPGEIYVPQVPSARVVDIADALMAGNRVPVTLTGIRPGEKVHEILVSEEERPRTIERAGYYVITPVLPELRKKTAEVPALEGEYSSSEATLSGEALRKLLLPALAEIEANVP